MSPAFRRCGVGSAIMRHALAQASNRPACAALALHVKADNAAAQGLYKRFDFVYVKHLPGYYQSPSGASDGWLMAR